MQVERLVHEGLEDALLCRHRGREAGQRPACGAHVCRILHTAFLDAAPRLLDHIVDHAADLPTHEFAEQAVARGAGKARLDAVPLCRQRGQCKQRVEVQKSRAQAVVDIVVVIGDIV